MRVLGINTATMVASVALVNHEKVITEYTCNTSQTHSQRLVPMIAQVLADGGARAEDLDGIAVACGPGSFTGLRIGVTTAKTLAHTLDKPLVGVPTLDGLAWQLAYTGGIICPILDARRQQVYTALYTRTVDRLQRESDYLATGIERLIELLLARGQTVAFLGDGVPVYRQILEERLGEQAQWVPPSLRLAQAASIAELGLMALARGQRDDPFTFQPLYIRRSEAEINWEAKQQMAGGQRDG